MKALRIISMCLAMALSVVSALAQNDAREPGLYAVNGEEATRLEFLPGITSNSATGILGVIELGKTKCDYKGETSSVRVNGNEFVLVINPEQKNAVRTMKKYDVFIKTMTPDNILIVPLGVKNKKRFYDKGMTVNGFNTQIKESLGFTWERISDNSFRIVAEGLVPGEYAFVFRTSKLDNFDFSAVFDFAYTGEAVPIGSEE